MTVIVVLYILRDGVTVAYRTLTPAMPVRFGLPQPWALPKKIMGVIPQLQEVVSMEAIQTGMTTVTGFMDDIFTLMTSNAYLATFMAAGFIYLGVRVFRWLKHAATK